MCWVTINRLACALHLPPEKLEEDRQNLLECCELGNEIVNYILACFPNGLLSRDNNPKEYEYAEYVALNHAIYFKHFSDSNPNAEQTWMGCKVASKNLIDMLKSLEEKNAKRVIVSDKGRDQDANATNDWVFGH